MLLRELMQLNEEEHTIHGLVRNLDQLIDPNTTGKLLTRKKYFTGTVNVDGDVYINSKELERIPVQFGEVKGSFNCDINLLTSLKGAPHTVEGNFHCANNRLISLVGINKILKRIKGHIYIGANPIQEGGIGLILVEGLTMILTDRVGRRKLAFEIIEKYLGQGKKGLLLCQEDLIEEGLDEFAKL